MDVASGFNSCYSMAVTENQLFYSCTDFDYNAALYSRDVDGANQVVNFTEADPEFSDGRSLKVDGDRLVWLDTEDRISSIRHFNLDGSDVRTHYTTTTPLTNNRLVANSKAFFFAEDGNISMLAR